MNPDERLQAGIIDALSQQPLIALDPALRIVHLNSQAEALFQTSLEAQRGGRCEPLLSLHGFTGAAIERGIERAGRGETVCLDQPDPGASQGALVSLRLQALQDQNGVLNGYLLGLQQVDATPVEAQSFKPQRERLLDILDLMPDGVLVIGPDRRLQYANRVMQRDYGDFSPISCDDYLCGDSQHCDVCVLKDAFSGSVKRTEWKAPGGERIYELFAAPLTDSNQGGSIICFLHDITQRKRIEKLLLEKEWYFSNLERVSRITSNQENLNILQMLDSVVKEMLGIFGSDRVWLLFPCNPDADSWRVPVEATREEYPGAGALADPITMTEETSELFREMILASEPRLYLESRGEIPREVKTEFGVRSQIVVAISPGIGQTWMLGMHQCSHERVWSDREVDLFSAIAERLSNVLTNLLLLERMQRDLQTRQETEALLKQSESRFRSFASHAPVGIFVSDPAGDCTYMNEYWSELSGRPPEQALGSGWVEAIHPDDRDKTVADWYENVASGGTEFVTQTRLCSPDGEVSQVQVRALPLFGEDGKVESFLGSIANVTELRRLQRELSQSRKMEAMGQLTGGIAHDFNNILGAILGFTDLSLGRYGELMPDKLLDYLNEVRKAGERGRDLVSQMMSFARGGETKPQMLDVEPMLKGMAKMLSATFPATIQVELELQQGLPWIYIDPVQLQQLIMNLCINARDAMHDHGRLRLGLQLATNRSGECLVCHSLFSGDWLELYVEDTGPGIDTRTLERMFDPFFTTKEVGKGTGMGLAVASSIIKQQGGHILVESELGKGTCFRLLFSLQGQPQQDGPRRESSPLPQIEPFEQRRILVIDDEEPLVTFLSELLAGHGFRVTGIRDSMEALRVIEEESQGFDLVITDQTMPEITGIELIEALRSRDQVMPVIICTGYSEQIDETLLRSLDIDGCFYKPLDPAQILQAVHKLARWRNPA